ncbi:MAG TPA: GNAT family N-acetyltransferase [Bdellovibrionota bacterium]|nr:GNAT family N-acetyltransferase [Bdellovibrionota bacterium]
MQYQVTYYEARIDQKGRPAATPRVSLARASEFPVYREMIRGLGRECQWVARTRLSDDELRSKFLSNRVWWVDSGWSRAGFCEVALRDGAAQICYLGVLPEFRGQGLATLLLERVLAELGADGLSRVFLKTCELDDPAATELYLKSGFRRTQQQLEDISID